MNIKHVIGYGATALVALGIGAASGSGGSGESSATAALATAPTVTVTAPAPEVPQETIAGPTVTQTVEVPGPTKTVTAPPPPPAVAMAGDGTYQVGVDVKPGTYVSKKPESGNCYWARLTGGDSLGSIIDNGNSAGQVVVTIKKSDKFFESSGCSDWTKR
ncbi:hypothetical protein [Humibacillus xanthopallidus]|uniref:Uncharacterized protein n=1 Tax=Humibacillus xanthopallidus TaxID=412689 RepID=A0A543HZP4_9MICO|nr:hypothetical protein [Humibacillus xanthopallidus]TQM63814.1 hypothetical protein FBY41_0167 [Humibacillus xanthopallidus]